MKTDIHLVAIILNGLLASGRYIYGDDDGGAKLLKTDEGKDFKEYCARRFSTNAIEVALEIHDELIEQIEINERLDKEE